jgi:hypothetical protein
VLLLALRLDDDLYFGLEGMILERSTPAFGVNDQVPSSW